MIKGRIKPSGTLRTRLIKKTEQVGLAWKIANFPNILRGWRVPLAKVLGIPTRYGTLRIRHFSLDGRVTDYGLVSVRVVTTAFVDFIVDQLQTETSEFGDFKFHDSGVGTTAANIADTDMETTDGEARATGSQTEGASANIYKSIGTITYTSSKAITEHGVFSQATGATLIDRTVFGAINVVSSDRLEFTYEITFPAGG